VAGVGLWLPAVGLVTLERRFVLALGGSCSFCGRPVAATGAVAGVLGRSPRVCDACIRLCLDILAEASLPPAAAKGAERADEELADLLAALDPAGGRVEAALSELQRRFGGRPRRWLADFRCSFCDTDRRDAAKLIAGPRVFICDVCTGEAASVVSTALAARA
jgi:hypothetical protein